MKLNHLTDDCLLSETDRLVRAEREILAQVLHHLREIERRRLFSALKFTSLFDYAVRRLGYPEDQAQRRIAAMRMIRDLPEIEANVEEGKLNLTQINLAKSAFARKEFTREEKIEIFEELEGKSARESETIILGHAPLPSKPEKMRPVSAEEIRLEFSVPAAMREKIETLRGRYAHTNPSMTMAELFEKLCDIGLEATSKEIKTAKPRKNVSKEKQIYTAAKSECANCGSEHALEKDHRIAKGVGGSDEIDNMRLLCRSCNQRAAIETYGVEKMDPYLNRGAAGRGAQKKGARPKANSPLAPREN